MAKRTQKEKGREISLSQVAKACSEACSEACCYAVSGRSTEMMYSFFPISPCEEGIVEDGIGRGKK
jgi:hypothetical protein